MSLPDEKLRAVIWTKRFLQELLDPKATPRVPRAIRTRAGWLLRHFPYEGELERMEWT